MKRFIAGAVCPECQQMDKIYVTQVGRQDMAICNACGYRSERPEVAPDSASKSISGHTEGVVKLIGSKEPPS